MTLFGVILVNRLCGRPLGQAAQDQSSELNEADTEELGPWVIKRADNEPNIRWFFLPGQSVLPLQALT